VRARSTSKCRLVEDKFYIFEINLRFSGTTLIAGDGCYNEPDVLIRKHLLGKTSNLVSPSSGVIRAGWMETLVERTDFPPGKDFV